MVDIKFELMIHKRGYKDTNKIFESLLKYNFTIHQHNPNFAKLIS